MRGLASKYVATRRRGMTGGEGVRSRTAKARSLWATQPEDAMVRDGDDMTGRGAMPVNTGP